MRQPEHIISEAIEKYKPAAYVLMVSGGHDSVTAAHKSASILTKMGLPFQVYHGDTTIGIPETQAYVRMICDRFGWPLSIRQPPNREEWYDRLVEKHGFPGPTKTSHQLMFRLLKERALRRFITHEVKSSPYSRENVLLITGIRNDESLIRMGYSDVTTKEDSRIWTSPIFYWSQEDCKKYMAFYDIPLNPVKEKICISGECLCGCFARKEEWIELKNAFPETAKIIEQLHEKAIANGKPWSWGMGPNEWRKERLKKMQLKMNFMCIGCDQKNSVA